MQSTIQITEAQKEAIAGILAELGKIIREKGSIPSGHLYAQLMGVISLEKYEQYISLLIKMNLIRKEPSHLLVWIGEKK
jgi:hypothetical protein